MSLLQTIKADQLKARKEKDTLRTSLLTTLLGEAQAVGKTDGNRETTDSETIAVIKKFLKNINETLGHRANDPTLLEERTVLMSYLPKQMDADQLTVLIQQIVETHDLEGPKAMGAVMKELKLHHDGQFDGKVASQVARDILS